MKHPEDIKLSLSTPLASPEAAADRVDEYGLSSVWRLDDNGNEFWMSDFPNEQEAEAYSRKYENKGHKQTYWIRSVVTPVTKVAVNDAKFDA